MRSVLVLALAIGGGVAAGSAYPQADQNGEDKSPKADAAPAAKSAAAPSLVIYFESGSSKLRPQDKAVLDQASRAYNEGKPIVMILTGSSDRVGTAQGNLTLSQRRASAVLTGLLDRGIPADRFQVLAKGETDLTVPTNPGVSEAENRRVEITWR